MISKGLTAPPPQLDRYHVSEEIGAGSMSTVYKATDPLIERTVALKVIRLPINGHGDPDYKERFFREAKSAGRLNHPGIVTIHDVGESGDHAYIAMEFLDGPSLKQILDEQGKLPTVQVLNIAADIADALAYAHAQGIVHRDIKPANVVITSRGVTKLTDFGIASLPAMQVTVPGLLVGSPRYMSPEQIEGRVLDGRSDLFSLGTVIYEALTGQPPFLGANMTSLMYETLHAEPTSPSELVAGVPPAVDVLLDRALAKKPADRYQSAEEMAHALKQLAAYIEAHPVEGSQTEGGVMSRVPVVAAKAQDKRGFGTGWLVGSALAAVLAAGAGWWYFSPGVDQPTTVVLAAPEAAPPADYTPPREPIDPAPPASQAEGALLPAANLPAAETTAAPRVATSSKVIKPDKGVRPKAATTDRSAAKPTRELDARLARLNKELADLKTRFTDIHPDVRAKQRQIRQLEEAKRNEG